MVTMIERCSTCKLVIGTLIIGMTVILAAYYTKTDTGLKYAVASETLVFPEVSISVPQPVVDTSNDTMRVCSQEERKKLIKLMCEKYGNPGSAEKRSGFTIDPVNKVAFLGIAKIGSTTWLSIMSNISMKGKLTSRHSGFHTGAINRYGLHRAGYTPKDFAEKLPGYTKFVVVRNPLHRLYSGYNNKIVKSKPAGYRNGLRKFLMGNKYNISVGETPPFEGFLQMIVSKHRLSRDAHFTSYFPAINPCYMDFDYILKLETQNRDVPIFLSQAYKIKDAASHLKVHQISITMKRSTESVVNDSAYLKEYEKIPPSLLNKVMQKFKYEIEFFGYSFNVSSSVANCGTHTSMDGVDTTYIPSCC